MSISLSGGDIAFIAAFIVLPTFILASCIWAIIAIRHGALLAQRAEPLGVAPEAEYDGAEELAAEQPTAVLATAAPDGADEGTAEMAAVAPQLADAPDDTLVLPTDVASEPTPPAVDEPAPAIVATEELAIVRDPSQETSEFVITAHDWSRPNGQAPEPLPPAEAPASAAPEPPAPTPADDEGADEAEVETWDTEPEPEPAAPAEADAAEEEPAEDAAPAAAEPDDVPDGVSDETTDLPPAAAVKRKPRRAAVAQLRPPVATTGRSRLRPTSARRPSDAGALALDEDAVQGDDGAVDVRGADNE